MTTKNLNTKCTIYLLTNSKNDKIYIGQTWLSLNTRMGKNGCNYKNSIYLYNAIQKYGVDNFHYEILTECDSQEYADILENENIIKYDSRNPKIGYNLKEGGSAGKHSDKTKAKISKTLKEKIELFGPFNDIAKIGKAWKGKKRGPQSEERKEVIAQNSKDWHANNVHPMKGKHHSEETLNKISEKSKMQWKEGKHTEESIKKGALARRMDPEKEQNILQAYLNGEPIAKIEEKFQIRISGIYRILKRNNIARKRPRDNWSGKKHSEETKQKMSETHHKNKLKNKIQN